MNREDERDEGKNSHLEEPWKLRLYVSCRTSLKSIVTLQNLTELCGTHLDGRFELEILDLIENFQEAREDHIIALPTLVRRSPLPVRKVIGDLSNSDQVITALGLPRCNENGP